MPHNELKWEILVERFMCTVFLALVFLLFFQNHAFAQDNGSTIRVGIFQNHPIVFIDDNGVPQGLYIDLLGEIAREEGWDIQFVPGTWTQGLERLRSSEIDLMTSIAYLEEREVYMDFSHENVLTMWGQVYVHQDSDIQDILDLQGGTVAILNGGVNGINFMDMVSKFDIQCEFRIVGTYAEVAELVASGDVAAGVINNVHGYEQEKQYAIRRSPIIFNPFSLLFAVPEGKNSHLLETIDSYLAKWKSDPESPYYSITAKWFGQKGKEALPDWVFRVLLFGVGILLLVAVWVFVLRRQVNIRTKELTESREVLRRSETLLAESQRIGHVGSWELNLVTNVLIWSDENYRIFGLEPQQFGATYEAFLDNIHPDDREMVNQAYTESVRNRTPYDIVHRVLLKDGTIKYVSEKSETFYSDNGKPIRSIGTTQDISERKQTEDELEKHRKHLSELVEERTLELNAANKELEGFSYYVSHDLRVPLRAIVCFSEIFFEDHAESLDKEGSRVLNVVRDNAERMERLIDDLLNFSHLGRKEIIKKDINMEKMVKDISKELKDNSPEQKVKMKIATLPPCYGDESLIREVLTNLLSNAIKFSKNEKNSLIEVGGELKDNENIYYVKDNGVGFDMKYSDKLFGVFQRLHSQEEFKGTGVGLALVQRIIHRHRGRIWAEGKVNKGATFYFTLPLREEAKKEAKKENEK